MQSQGPFDIAWSYLAGTGEIEDEQAAVRIITQTIDRLTADGVSHPLVLAIRAIRLYKAFKEQHPMKMVS